MGLDGFAAGSVAGSCSVDSWYGLVGSVAGAVAGSVAESAGKSALGFDSSDVRLACCLGWLNQSRLGCFLG